MKKLIALLLTALLTLALTSTFTACGGGSEEDNRPVLKVGMECGYQPYNWTQFDNSHGAVPIKNTAAGQYANGYDVKIAKLIADSLNMKLEIYAYEWGSLVPACESGALDLIIAGMSPTAERKLVIDFSDAYLTSNLVVVVRKDGPFANATCLADLAGGKIVAQDGTFHAEVASQISNRTGAHMKDFPSMIVALNAKTIDGYIAEEPGAIADCNGNPDLKYISLTNNQTGFTVEDLTNVTIAIGVQKGSALLAQVNGALANITDATRMQLLNEAIEPAAVLGL